jgi:cytochrome c-type biogenesis protein CcmH/NrfF
MRQSKTRLHRGTGVIGCLLIAAAAFAQTPQIESDDVARVGSHIACQCGSCKETVTCPMAKRGCSFCSPAKERIYKLQKAGMSDAAIIDTYKKQYGDKIFVADPSALYWIVPALAIVAGMVVIALFVRRFKPRPLPVVAGLDSKYREQIERETANLD